MDKRKIIEIERDKCDGCGLCTTAFALGSFHQDLLEGKKPVIACPKLDDTEGYIETLAEIIKRNGLKSLAVPS